ncbi:hypothetical protein [Halomicrococcus gelatinilyticus]|uniref:hypothetical protein n=1 Tax=Halomicrococcus gelatinilyticus TaxID=1702103 RepID=UPI002E10F50F
MRSRSRIGTVVGLAMFVVAVVGYVVYGWRFGDGVSSPVAMALALVAVAVAVALNVRKAL